MRCFVILCWNNIPFHLKALMERPGKKLDWFGLEFGGHSGQFDGLLGTAVFDFTDRHEETLSGNGRFNTL